MMNKDEYVVLYDGDCGFCNFWVKWILSKDKKQQFKFASLQGNYGQAFLKKNQLNTTDFDTLYLVSETGSYFQKLEAVIKICTTIGGLYSLAAVLKIVPVYTRDAIYGVVSRNRKRVLQGNCYLPTAEQRKMFID